MRQLAVVLLLMAGTALAAGGSLSTLAEPDPARAAAGVDRGWLAFSVPVRAGTRSPCCWQGQWNQPTTMECRLQDEQHSHGTRQDSPLTASVKFYAQLREGQVRQLLLAGPDCPVDAAGAQVTELAAVDETATLDWLESLARSGRNDVDHQAMYALAMVAGDELLFEIARDPGRPDELRRQAFFWLAQSDSEATLERLTRLLTPEPGANPIPR